MCVNNTRRDKYRKRERKHETNRSTNIHPYPHTNTHTYTLKHTHSQTHTHKTVTPLPSSSTEQYPACPVPNLSFLLLPSIHRPLHPSVQVCDCFVAHRLSLLYRRCTLLCTRWRCSFIPTRSIAVVLLHRTIAVNIPFFPSWCHRRMFLLLDLVLFLPRFPMLVPLPYTFFKLTLTPLA